MHFLVRDRDTEDERVIVSMSRMVVGGGVFDGYGQRRTLPIVIECETITETEMQTTGRRKLTS
jgi:hypothetical protein